MRFVPLSKIVFCHNTFSSAHFVIIIFVERNSQKASGNIDNIVKAQILKCQSSIVAALSRSAMQIYRFVFWNFICSFPQLTQRNVDCSFNVSALEFRDFPYINNDTVIFNQFSYLINIHLPEITV